MPLVTSTEIFKKAYGGGWAVGAFNVNNMEIIQGIMAAVNEEKAPVILQFSAGGRKYASPVYLNKLVEAALEETEMPVVLHLDHGEDFEICKACVDQGFTSVMIDASKHPLEENIRIVKEVVDYAHERGAVVEAELGRLAGIEDNISVDERDAILTDPDEAKRLVDETGVDSLAVAIGTSHGAYKFKADSEPKLYFDRVREIMEKLPGFPLVLHGASSVIPEFVEQCNKYGGNLPDTKGVPESAIAEAIRLGVCKVNIDTDLRLAMTGTIRKEFAENPANFDPRKYLGPAREAIKGMVVRKLRLLGASGHGPEFV